MSLDIYTKRGCILEYWVVWQSPEVISRTRSGPFWLHCKLNVGIYLLGNRGMERYDLSFWLVSILQSIRNEYMSGIIQTEAW